MVRPFVVTEPLAVPTGIGPFNTGGPILPTVSDDRTVAAWWVDLDRGWKAVLLGLGMTVAAQLWHGGVAGAIPF